MLLTWEPVDAEGSDVIVDTDTYTDNVDAIDTYDSDRNEDKEEKRMSSTLMNKATNIFLLPFCMYFLYIVIYVGPIKK